MEHPGGGRVDIELVRPLAWLEDLGVTVGTVVFLYMSDMGAFGWTKVITNEFCPLSDIPAGPFIIGKFRHTSGEVYDMRLEASPSA